MLLQATVFLPSTPCMHPLIVCVADQLTET